MFDAALTDIRLGGRLIVLQSDIAPPRFYARGALVISARAPDLCAPTFPSKDDRT
ncbi:MAG: hypothetical protein JJU15_11675 [Pararhodobacter sp.]|nr:hypothetical protein [Pararhodobacter sp.]